MENYNLERLSKSIVESLSLELDRVGIMHRIYYRCKSVTSIATKIRKKGYDGEYKFLRDLIGVRINLYFIDDLKLVSEYISKMFTFKEQTVDHPDETVFKPTRINYVFEIPEYLQKEFRETVKDSRIDTTFELQLRTVFSEGWHEVEHDLRYKHLEHWQVHGDLSRMFNGILAALETNDWSMLALLDQLTYRHYKTKNWDAMIRTKLRIRIDSSTILSSEIIEVFEQNLDLTRTIFKLDRNKILDTFLTKGTTFPLSIDNIVYYINFIYLKDIELDKLTSKILLQRFE